MIRMSPDLFCSDLGTFLLELIQTMIKYLFFTVAAILVLATACDRNNFPEVQTENRPIEYDLEDKVNTKLASFVDWLNENPASDNTPETKASASSDSSDLINDSKFSQIITKNFTIGVDSYPMYGTYREWHGWVTTYAHALFSRSIDWNTSLNVSPDRLSFYRTPRPTSTESSGSYTTGFSASRKGYYQGCAGKF